MQISGNTFLVSGGASGLGGATSRLLAESGANVVIADINKDKGEALAAELGANTRFVVCNVTDEDSVKAAVAVAVANFGGLNGLVNCAGIGTGEKTVGKDGPHSLARFKRVIEVNLIGTFNVIRLAAAQMSSQEAKASGERGVIVNTASIAAFDGQASSSGEGFGEAEIFFVAAIPVMAVEIDDASG